MEIEKVALLDTDFISKTHISQSDSDHLIDKILTIPDYRFFCHEQVKIELSRHTPYALAWLEERINATMITCYSDSEILDRLETVYGSSCCYAYRDYLQKACDAFGRKHYENYYASLSLINYTEISKQDFLKELSAADESVGTQNSLGEIKTYVLLQTLQTVFGIQVYLFCSDDGNARRGAAQFDDISCISLISSFVFLKNKIGLTKEHAQPYFDSWVSFCVRVPQLDYKVLEPIKNRKYRKVLWEQLFRDMYDDKFLLLQDGYLKYKPED